MLDKVNIIHGLDEPQIKSFIIFLTICVRPYAYGITVSYWKDVESTMKWRMNADHQQAQKSGKEKWYKNYKIRICKVERDYEF